MEGGDSLAVDLAKRDFEQEASKRYKEYVIISKLKRVLNEAVKCNALAREEEVQRFPFRHIKSGKSTDRRVLGSIREMRDAFRTHFRDRFARCPDLQVREFRSYLTDFPRLREAEAARFEGLVTEYKLCDALKQVGLNKSPDLMVYPTKSTWGCRACLCLFWRMCSTIGSPRRLAGLEGASRLRRTSLWREDQSKTTCIWRARS